MHKKFVLVIKETVCLAVANGVSKENGGVGWVPWRRRKQQRKTEGGRRSGGRVKRRVNETFASCVRQRHKFHRPYKVSIAPFLEIFGADI
jgi:hypothetical protein